MVEVKKRTLAASAKKQTSEGATKPTKPEVSTTKSSSPASSLPEPVLSADRVMLLGAGIIGFGMIGFYSIPGLIKDDASGSGLVNSFYCAVMTLTTIGFGDICPGETDIIGELFVTILSMIGIGFFCGPLLSVASQWKHQVPGGIVPLATMTLGMGMSMFTALEGMSYSEAFHLCIIAGTTIGYGNLTPATNLGKVGTSLYAILACNVMGALLEPARTYFESFCQPKRIVQETSTSAKKNSTSAKKKHKRLVYWEIRDILI